MVRSLNTHTHIVVVIFFTHFKNVGKKMIYKNRLEFVPVFSKHRDK